VAITPKPDSPRHKKASGIPISPRHSSARASWLSALAAGSPACAAAPHPLRPAGRKEEGQRGRCRRCAHHEAKQRRQNPGGGRPPHCGGWPGGLASRMILLMCAILSASE
jgi:hypothetical protein